MRQRGSYIGGMRKGITVKVLAVDRARLEAVVADRNSPQKHVWRAKIILATAEGLGTNAIMRRAGVSKPCVWRWQARFATEGIAGLLRDKTRPPGAPPLPEATAERVVELTRQAPPGEATHWTGRAMAKAVGISLSAVQGIWKTHGLVPHRIRTFKLVQRSGVQRQAAGRRRPLHEPASAGGGAVGGREKPDPSARPHTAGVADEGTAMRDHDP
jgi:transposase